MVFLSDQNNGTPMGQQDIKMSAFKEMELRYYRAYVKLNPTQIPIVLSSNEFNNHCLMFTGILVI